MRKAFVLTAYNRPDYLEQTLASLTNVRGWADWDLYISIDPSDRVGDVLAVVNRHAPTLARLTQLKVVVRDTHLGVLGHPWHVFTELFDEGYDYVVRSEDDLIHGQDVLEYQSWGAETYEHDPAVGIITSFVADTRRHDEVHRKIGLGSPLVIGTWKSLWNEVYRDNWDFDYSTGDHGRDAGWDYHLNLRVMPPRGLHAILPNHAKVYHLGVWGAHSTPQSYYQMPEFDPNIPPQNYREVFE